MKNNASKIKTTESTEKQRVKRTELPVDRHVKSEEDKYYAPYVSLHGEPCRNGDEGLENH